MCCAEVVVKYVLFFANLLFSLAGIALIGIGIAVLVQIKDILDLIPVNINTIPISIIVIGSIIFIIAFCGCCGAVRESQCLLVLYAVCMIILAGLKIWLTVVIFNNLNNLHGTVAGWVNNAFNLNNLGPFHVLEVAFQCCGTTGANSYVNQNVSIPATCCANPVNNVCIINDSFQGCSDRLANYFETFGDAIGAVLITIIVVELVAMIFALFLSHTITNKERRSRY